MSFSNVIAVVSLIFSIAAFCYSMKYKKLEGRLNSLEIEEKEKNQLEMRKAELNFEIELKSNGLYDLFIINDGKAVAENIKVEKIKGNGLEILEKNKLELDKLDPNKSFKLKLTKTFESDDKLTLKLTWDDEYSKNREKERKIPI